MDAELRHFSFYTRRGGDDSASASVFITGVGDLHVQVKIPAEIYDKINEMVMAQISGAVMNLKGTEISNLTH